MTQRHSKKPLVAGRELDALVAEKVMGWKAENNKNCSPNTWFDSRYVTDEHHGYDQEWSPSRSISDAWEVVEKMNKDVGLFDIGFLGEAAREERYKWNAEFGESGDVYAATAPLAICLTALQIVDMETRHQL